MAKRAKANRCSLNTLCLDLLTAGLAGTTREPTWNAHVRKLIDPLHAHFGEDLLGLLVFGSQVSGEATEQSDLDLLIVLADRLPLHRGLYRWWDQQIHWTGPMEANPHFVHLPPTPREAGSLWFEVALQHEIVYQRGRRVEQTVAQLLGLMGTRQVRREWSHGAPYWVWTETAEPRPEFAIPYAE